MAYKSLETFIHDLEQAGELLRIKAAVNPELEMTEITDRISKLPGGGKALLFENSGTSFPVLMNGMGSVKRMCMALGVENLDHIGSEIGGLLREFTAPGNALKEKLKMLPKLNQISSWMPKSINGRGICQEVVITEPDLGIFPVLKCWPEDGGKFITLPIVHTIDPDTGIRNVGMYRMQVFNGKTTGMHWHRHKVGARHYNEYKKKGKPMPIAVALGGDPAYTYAATAPLPDNIDEYMLAGFLRKRKVELVRCLTQNIEVPADVDIVIEGFVDPGEPMTTEGPFGDHTGFYSLAGDYPEFHVTCITHKKNAIYPATIVGIPPMEDAYIAKATERLFLVPLQLSVLPELMDMNLPHEGVAHNLTIVKIRKNYPGQARKVMNAMWGAGQMMLNKILIVVDGDVDIHDYEQLAKHVAKHYHPGEDTCFSRGPLDVLDHAAQRMGYGGKMGLDATMKFPEEISGKENHRPSASKADAPAETLPECVNKINTKLLDKDLGILLVSIDKENVGQLMRAAEELIRQDHFETTRIMLLVDSEVDVDDIGLVAWLLGNNIDPNRDCKLLSVEQTRDFPCLVIDGTRKIKGREHFGRLWPNIIVSDQNTIDKVDDMWPELELGPPLPSPSLKFLPLVKRGGAAVDE